MTSLVTDLDPVVGRVKWFDPVKGFGFIVADDGGSDILLHANVLRNYGQGSVADHAQITVRVQVTPRGAQAVEVLEILPPDALDAAMVEEVHSPDAPDLDSLPLVAARVKWFDKAKGFGFANAFGRPEDVFIHAEVLRRSGYSDLQPGEAICIRTVDGKRGTMAAQILSWDTAQKARE